MSELKPTINVNDLAHILSENGICLDGRISVENIASEIEGLLHHNTRATPSADTLTGLQRYTFMKRDGLLSSVDPTSYGRYVLHSEASQIITEQAAVIERLKEQNDKFKWQVRDTCTRSEAAEAELDKLKAQEPVAWMHPEARWTDVSKQEVAVHCKVRTYPLPLYAAPVSDSLKAECERLRLRIKLLEDVAKPFAIEPPPIYTDDQYPQMANPNAGSYRRLIAALKGGQQ